MATATRVDVSNCITLTAPVSWVAGFKLGHAGNRSRRNTDDLPFVHAFARTFAEVAPGDDAGDFLGGIDRTVNVCVDDGTVTQGTCDILVTDDIVIGHN